MCRVLVTHPCSRSDRRLSDWRTHPELWSALVRQALAMLGRRSPLIWVAASICTPIAGSLCVLSKQIT